jgi:hypothetical protein
MSASAVIRKPLLEIVKNSLETIAPLALAEHSWDNVSVLRYAAYLPVKIRSLLDLYLLRSIERFRMMLTSVALD